MSDVIIVTLYADGFEKDLELPWKVALGELYPRLHEVLKQIRPSLFSQYSGIILEKDGKGMLKENATLADYGICTGACLDVVGEGKYYVQ